MTTLALEPALSALSARARRERIEAEGIGSVARSDLALQALETLEEVATAARLSIQRQQSVLDRIERAIATDGAPIHEVLESLHLNTAGEDQGAGARTDMAIARLSAFLQAFSWTK